MSDFGVLTAIAIMVVIAVLVKPYVPIEVIIVTPNYAPTTPSRGWFINPFDGSISIGEIFAAIIPAILVSYYSLVNVEQH